MVSQGTNLQTLRRGICLLRVTYSISVKLDQSLLQLVLLIFQKTQPIKDATSSGLVRTNQQAKGAAPRAQVRPVVFANPSQESSCSQVLQMSPFKTAASVFSSSKRFRQNSAANLYRTSSTSFPDNL